MPGRGVQSRNSNISIIETTCVFILELIVDSFWEMGLRGCVLEGIVLIRETGLACTQRYPE